MAIQKLKFVLAFMLTAGFMTTVLAQDEMAAKDSGYNYTPKDRWELGINAGHAFVSGDVGYEPSFGVGISLRKALDYIFSLRGDLMYAAPQGSDDGTGARSFESTWIEGSLQGVITLNNFKFDKPKRKFNPYAFVGGGFSYFETDFENVPRSRGGVESGTVDAELNPMLNGGAGISYRVNPNFNIGIEHKASIIFGANADLIDGDDNQTLQRTTYRDIFNYTSLRLNFNIGKKSERTEPLYWLNPLDLVLNDISELKARPKLDLTDTDADGVIDMLDGEVNTPAGAPVNVKGIALDSDNDGVADYQDDEPYSMPGAKVDGKGVAAVIDYATPGDVDRKINEAFKKYELSEAQNALVDWFLPMVHFDVDSYKIRYADYGNLANIASVMKKNNKVKIVVQGFTDKTASDSYNQGLSYNRARAAIDFLATNHGISRDRLILNYGGEENNLVPTNGSSFMNRRVEFRVASGETEMAPPSNTKAGRGPSFQGNKAGY